MSDPKIIPTSINAFISLALLVVIALSGWTLQTTQELKESSAVQKIRIEHIKKNISDLSGEIKRDVEARYLKIEGDRLDLRMDALNEQITRQWNIINMIRAKVDK